MLLTTLAGLGFGLSLIVAIGAQNAYVLRQGLRREHVLAVVIVCAASDAVLILVGVAGFGALIRTVPISPTTEASSRWCARLSTKKRSSAGRFRVGLRLRLGS